MTDVLNSLTLIVMVVRQAAYIVLAFGCLLFLAGLVLRLFGIERTRTVKHTTIDPGDTPAAPAIAATMPAASSCTTTTTALGAVSPLTTPAPATADPPEMVDRSPQEPPIVPVMADEDLIVDDDDSPSDDDARAQVRAAGLTQAARELRRSRAWEKAYRHVDAALQAMAKARCGWNIEREVIIDGHRVPFLLLSPRGVVAVLPADGFRMSDMDWLTAIIKGTKALFPNASVEVALVMPFADQDPNQWFNGVGAGGAWMMGLGQFPAWLASMDGPGLSAEEITALHHTVTAERAGGQPRLSLFSTPPQG